MTIEQEIQTAIRASIMAELETAELNEIVAVHAQKLDAIDDKESEQEFPAIVVSTSTPVPQGHKSSNINVPLWITAMTYIPEDKTKDLFSKMCEIVFKAIHSRESWDTIMPTSNKVDIAAVTIDGGEENSIDGFSLEQTTSCTVNASYLHA